MRSNGVIPPEPDANAEEINVRRFDFMDVSFIHEGRAPNVHATI
jgi:hypothetical protein